MENRNVYSVSFKRSEKELKEFALTHEGFSEYIKRLIKLDKERAEVSLGNTSIFLQLYLIKQLKQ